MLAKFLEHLSKSIRFCEHHYKCGVLAATTPVVRVRDKDCTDIYYVPSTYELNYRHRVKAPFSSHDMIADPSGPKCVPLMCCFS